MSLRLFVIRHGETEWSLSGRYTGRSDIVLTKNGEAEALKIGCRVVATDFAHVLVSPLKRAKQTCDLAGHGGRARVESDLVEWDNGEYEGLTLNEIRSKHPNWNIFHDGCPHGESPQQVSDRVDRLIVSLSNLDGNVALFTHGHLARALAARWIRISVQFAHNFLLNTASLSMLSKHQENQPAITLWNSSCLENYEHTPTQQSPAQVQSQPSASKPVEIERWENEGGEIPAETLKKQFHRSV